MASFVIASKGGTTTDHETIRRWAEARGGRPVAAKGGIGKGDAERIGLAFPDAPQPDAGVLELVSWDEWFRRFDEDALALLIEETTSAGQRSLFNKLVRR